MRDEKCQVCGAALTPPERGRRPVYCSRACQAKAYRARRTPAVPRDAAPSERRTAIARVVWQIAADHGLDAVSMRAVAAAAGVSVRVVQYHFGTKHQLLVDSLELLHRTNEQLAAGRIQADLADPKALLRAVLDEFLPLDAHRRLSLRALAGYYARSLTDPALAAVFLAGDRSLEDFVALVLRYAEEQGELRSGVHVASTADLLVSGVTGLALDVVHGTRSARDVREIIARQLDQLFRDATRFPAKPATRR
ncbi:TetR family transcriptional regulator C-terminal domain-containing protein [Kribbella sp. NPDC005582]|uniref:TetR/AcrR family transcriptional regulator n=1 Tax=Kribbella sp. NPDC005582 TaxID=3156893 RepID=UPI0033B8068D